MNLILTGNPNTGKTTIYNLLTKSNEHVGNWHGVTITEKSKQTKHFNVVDLPGLYSLNNIASLEENNAVEYLKKHSEDVILNIVDANNLERNLFLTTQLIQSGYKVCLLVNLTTKKTNKKIDYSKLSQKLNVPVIATNGKNRNELINNLLNLTFNQTKLLRHFVSEEEIYNFVNEIIDYAVTETNKTLAYGLSKLDKLLLNKYLALPIFFALIFAIFYLTFSSVGSYLSDQIRNSILSLCNNSQFLNVYLQNNAPAFYNFVNECLINGVLNVLCFLPQITILNLCLNILEESGYISRLAFLFDDVLSALGLSGKGVFTLLMGIGCSATAITTSANMQNKNSKNKLALLTPNISCSAKLPIYTIIGSAFFGVNNIFIIAGLYLLGLVVLMVQAYIYNKIKPTNETFILEFPPLRVPSFKRVLLNSFKTAINFILKAGSVILLFSCIIWVLQHFTYKFKFTTNINESLLKHISTFLVPIFMPLGFNSWGLVASLISGLVAKEMVISSIGILNGVGIDMLANSLTNSSSAVFFTHKTAIVFLVFCLLYTPCMATYAMQKNMCGRKIALLSMAIQFVTAYVISMLMQTILTLCSFWQGIVALICIFEIILIIRWVLKNKKRCNGNCENCSTCILK